MSPFVLLSKTDYHLINTFFKLYIFDGSKSELKPVRFSMRTVPPVFDAVFLKKTPNYIKIDSC